MKSTIKGTICGISAAVSYGLNPMGALPLMADGVNTASILVYRYALASLIMIAYMAITRQSLAITAKQLRVILPLGFLFSVSSLTLFLSFTFMGAGIASTLLFIYPVLVAVIMAVVFHERITAVTVSAIALALAGIVMLYRGGDGETLSTVGVALVMLSSTTYAIYIVVVNRAQLQLSTVVLTTHVLIVGTLVLTLTSLIMGDTMPLQLLTTPSQWGHALLLALFPTVLSLLLLTVAVHEIGSTPTAIMGALEPMTAVLVSVTMFGEPFSIRFAFGMLLILGAVMLIVVGKNTSIHSVMHAVKHLVPHHKH